MNKFSVGFIFLVLLISCTKSKSNESLISNTNVNFKISRFEQQFYTSNKKTLPKLMGEYPYLFPTKNDSIWLAKIKNEHNLFLKTQQVFKDFSSEKNELIDVLKHLKYYFPKFKSPHFITLITNLDYDNKIIYADSLCFISLDLYLGKNSKVYNDFPTYLKQNYNPNQIQVDVAKSIVRKLHRPYRSNLFLNEMINKGKDLYVVRAIVPKVQIEKIMGYSKEQWNWAKANELPIWTYFVDKELLFSSKS
ncbi:MAG: gliding motility lipoprotein GldB, partial [Lutibacter sp.]